MRADAGGGLVDVDSGNEMIDGAGFGILRNARRARPVHAVGRGAQHDVVLGTAGAKPAVLPNHIDFAAPVHRRGRQRTASQIARLAVVGDAGDTRGGAPCAAAIRRHKRLHVIALERHHDIAVRLHDGLPAQSERSARRREWRSPGGSAVR